MYIDRRLSGINKTTGWEWEITSRCVLDEIVKETPHQESFSFEENDLKGSNHVIKIDPGERRIVMIVSDRHNEMRLLKGSFGDFKREFPSYRAMQDLKEGIVLFSDDLQIHEFAPIDDFYHVKIEDGVEILIDYTADTPNILFA